MSDEKVNGNGFTVVDKRKVSEEAKVEVATDNSEKPEQTPKVSDINETQEQSHGNESSSSKIPFEADFSTFVYSLNTQALLFMGKIPNPMTGKYEKDLDTAKYLIDTIDMLSKKTKGNLDENETKLIENILYDLRMAYISEKK